MKYCSNCGTKVEGNFCANCGNKIEVSNNVISNDVNEYLKKQMENKKNHNAYRLSVGIIMIVLGAIILFAGMVINSALSSSDYREVIKYAQYAKMNLTLAFILPGISVLAGGILSILSRKNNILLLISGIAYFLAAILNLCAISDISILFVVSCIFGSINIAFYTKAQ